MTAKKLTDNTPWTEREKKEGSKYNKILEDSKN